MTEQLWESLVQVAHSLSIEPSLYDKSEIVKNSVCRTLINKGNYKAAWVHYKRWMKT